VFKIDALRQKGKTKGNAEEKIGRREEKHGIKSGKKLGVPSAGFEPATA
jgi:hypothetical protein